jgi:hypothetical protein
MTAGQNPSPLCARVFDRLVESGDVVGDAELETHLGSCMACYRTLTELRDVPRLAAMMRAGASAERQEDSRFWTEAADHTTDAVMAAFRAGSPASLRARRVWARVAVATTLVAAAAMVAIVVGRPQPLSPATVAGSTSGSSVVESARLAADEDPSEDSDVADLDTTSLQRLIDRLRAGAPDQLAALAETESGDGMDGLVEDDAELSDELVELDQAALVRVQRSLSGSAL